MSVDVPVLQFEEAYEDLIEGLLNQEFGVCTGLLDESTIIGLRNNLIQHWINGEMRPAGVGQKFDFTKNVLVRGDLIKWISNDSTNIFEVILMDRIREFYHYLNSTCFTSINDFEFHYAFYEQGSFYKKHLDQFKNDRGRQFSLVFYINDNWLESDGGNLSIHRIGQDIVNIYPSAGQVVFFKSDEIEHEVHPSLTRYRLSIAGWLKQT
ncbi:MAG: SM-20-related protein [Cyclobacteriaceae bacterium]|jgi:SM-20-related protein